MRLLFSGERLRRARASADLSQIDAASAIGVDSSTYRSWEYSKNTPSVNSIPAIVSTFHVDLESLYVTADGKEA